MWLRGMKIRRCLRSASSRRCRHQVEMEPPKSGQRTRERKARNGPGEAAVRRRHISHAQDDRTSGSFGVAFTATGFAAWRWCQASPRLTKRQYAGPKRTVGTPAAKSCPGMGVAFRSRLSPPENIVAKSVHKGRRVKGCSMAVIARRRQQSTLTLTLPCRGRGDGPRFLGASGRRIFNG